MLLKDLKDLWGLWGVYMILSVPKFEYKYVTFTSWLSIVFIKIDIFFALKLLNDNNKFIVFAFINVG